MRVEWEEGSELSQSRKKPGDFSPLTRDADNNLVGQVTLSDIEEDDVGVRDHAEERRADPEPVYIYVTDDRESERRAAEEREAQALLLLGVVLAVRKAAPHVKRWWTDQAVPFLKKSRTRPSEDRDASDQVSVAEYFTLPGSAPTESTQEGFAALDEYRASMSSAEARERLVAALVARYVSEEHLRVLRNARIEDDGAAQELASAMEALTPEQLAESITLMLEANPSWAEVKTLAELEEIVERRSRGEGEHAPVRSEPTKKALHPPRSEE